MLSKRIVAISKDQKFQKRLTAGLMAAGGAVEVVDSVADLTHKRLDSDLYVYHYADPETLEFGNLLAKVKTETPIIVILPTPDLGRTVDLMRDTRISNVLVAEDLDVSRLSNAAAKILFGDVFGLEKFVPWGVRIYSMLVGDYQEKSVAIASISDFADAMGVRRKYRESIELNMDELLMNALYDAPVDEAGRRVFAEIDVKTRIGMQLEQKAVVQYACDGDRFAVSVRDTYGMLTKEIVLKFVEKALRSAHQIDRKEGGAGLGLFMVANSSTEFYVNLYPGVATEVICIFDLSAPKLMNRNMGVYMEKIDPTARMAQGSARPRKVPGRQSGPSAPAFMKVALIASMLMFAGSAGWLLYKMNPKIETGKLQIAIEPEGANVFIDDVHRGKAPITIPALEVGTHSLRAEADGYRPVREPVRVSSDSPTDLSFKLERLKGMVTITSTPPGGRLFLNGTDTGKLTPTTLDTQSGQELKLSVRLPGYVESSQTVPAPADGQSTTTQFALQLLPGYAMLKVKSDPPGGSVLLNDVEQSQLTDTYVLKAGAYELTVVQPGFVPFVQRVAVKPGDHRIVEAKLVQGGFLTLVSNVEARVLVDGRVVGKTPIYNLGLSEGSHVLTLRRPNGPTLSYQLRVAIKKGERIDRDLQFGTVEIGVANVVARGALTEGREVTALALPAGTHKLSLLNKTTGEKRDHEVTVVSGQKVEIEKW